MTVAELIAKLQTLPQELIVLTAGDNSPDYRNVKTIEVEAIKESVFTDCLDFGDAEQITAVVLT